ncbi:GNAT family N-acetyltransferase [Methanogenium sp. S4BF]|uniref:GNAT family N-acetyltransferase n=1 Tax=Methanogenium sp. S4BF TaxID=1789226 RepID=UPI0024170C5A|nr:GNAT family N-acetyltransferase [Methanogenium sp. S4BF]WFN35027.1 GNAT family N-acetyltransferase [Methanogenium sp. S4BF]
MKIPIEELSFLVLQQNSDLTSFECTEPELSDFLKENAKNYQKTHMAITYPVHYEGNVAGYFTLVNDNIFHEHVEEDDRPPFFIHTRYPAIKIARLATSQKYEGRGIGESMLKVVIKLALNISEISGCRILTVDAKPKAVGFYEKYGFRKVLRKSDDTIPLYRDFHTDYQ